MWANAQRDGRPAEHRWRPLFNAAKFGWRPQMPCSNAAKTRNPLKFAGMPETTGSISAASGPKFAILWGHVETYYCLTSFFPIVDMCPSCEDIARQNCAMVPRWRFFATFCVLYFHRAACSTLIQTCILNSHKGHTMCASMADIQSVMAEIRQGKKRKIEETTAKI